MPNDAPPPLVLLHAFPLDSRMFDRIRNALPGIDLITPDQRGFGSASIVDDDGTEPAPDLARVADDVRTLMDTRGIERAVVGGVSMGGYVALQFLARHPARLAGLLLADTKAVADTAEQAANRNSIADRAEAGEVPAGADLVAPLLGPAASEQVRTLAAALADDAAPPAVAWAQRAMAVRPDSTDVLAAAVVPVLVVVGEHDTVTPPDGARRMAEAARDATFVQIAGAGHLTPLEDPAAFAATVRDWIKAQSSTLAQWST